MLGSVPNHRPIMRQTARLLTRAGFFLLFVLAPPLDIFRLDLNLGHFILFGQNWTLGLEPFLRGEASSLEAVWAMFWRGLLPLLALVGGGLWLAWKYGRLYCGWLCPHFSAVETINNLMRRASGKPTLWERQPLPTRRADGGRWVVSRRWWPLVGLAVAGFAFLWALTLLTYLVTPIEVYHNLLAGELTRFQGLFLGAATLALALEFTLARHLFCRYGCAVGLFQSYAWMANPKALVVGFDTKRAAECAACFSACDHACPMRLPPRAIKRKMFACTQCTLCIGACETVQKNNPRGPLLRWVQGEAARAVSDREPGTRLSQRRRPVVEG